MVFIKIGHSAHKNVQGFFSKPTIIAYCIFVPEKEGKPVSFTMEAISPLTDFSFDFQDLLLKKQ
jgi:hypothetical protein